MDISTFNRNVFRIGFVSTRFQGTDGVSLETEKWVTVLERIGHTCFYFSGLCDRDSDICYVVPEADFKHPEISDISSVAFSRHTRPPEVTQRIHKLKVYLKEKIFDFVRHFNLDLLIIENALAIPMNIPLGLALTEFIAETGFHVIAHHHDFFWERQRFSSNCVGDYLTTAFPPFLPSIHHVVINSIAGNELSRRTGISSTIIPNVMDFERLPKPVDDYASDVPQALGIEKDELFFLQPTRVVHRKGIEHAIELINRLGVKARLVISHGSGDEGYEYEQRVADYAELLKVPVTFECDIIKTQRGLTDDGRKIYTLYDVYPHADLVTYPSSKEGFGNAFLEAIYFRRPIFVNCYSIYEVDIKPKGFRVIEFNGYITKNTIQSARRVLNDASLAEEMVEMNYALARRYYSFAVLRRILRTLIVGRFGENRYFN